MNSNTYTNTEITTRLIKAAISTQRWERVGELIHLREIQETDQILDEVAATLQRVRSQPSANGG